MDKLRWVLNSDGTHLKCMMSETDKQRLRESAEYIFDTLAWENEGIRDLAKTLAALYLAVSRYKENDPFSKRLSIGIERFFQLNNLTL